MVLLKEPVQPLPRSSLLYNNASNSSSRIKETRKVKLLYNPLTKRQILNNFEILATLGNGQYGKVKLARDLGTGALVAIKILNRFEKRSGYSLQLKVENPRVNQEIEVMKRCHHENVVELYEILNDPESTKVYLVLEYFSRGPVKWCPENKMEIKAVGPSILTFQQSRKVVLDVVSGLEYLHSQGITHRDIKPSNLLISSNGTVKISDFGVAMSTATGSTNIQSSHEQLLKSRALGTPAFFAPELCSTEKEYSCSSAIDIWSLGVTIYCLLFGKLPFNANSGLELFDSIINKPLEFPSYEEMLNGATSGITMEEYTDAKDLLKKLLQKDPDKRIKLADIKVHPFMCHYGKSDAASVSTNLETFHELKVSPPSSCKRVELVSLPVNSSFASLDSVYMENFDHNNLRTGADRNSTYSPSIYDANTLSPSAYHNIGSRESSYSSFSSFTSSTAFASQISIQDAPAIGDQQCLIGESGSSLRVNSCEFPQYTTMSPVGEYPFESTEASLSSTLTPVGNVPQRIKAHLVEGKSNSKDDLRIEADASLVFEASDAQRTRRRMSLYKL
ncbi:CBK_G0018690.mRNA.1.CDS.1 [Saccharomyces cerevisiae]|nr:Tos3p [Saccharomyces cerevisiae YJM627]CAD6469398.1 Y55_G0031800.mRNA.1.CDS.1 [Saccharomyces cerevisiae]CAI4472626.1 CBK_G0018690.mRNA.1.CDS.1 [Saccharomyces cerevisiae]CAI7290966.1 CBK_G0018690.mRNA.1.CDS.1 [Saccharomyces cerevisiae]